MNFTLVPLKYKQKAAFFVFIAFATFILLPGSVALAAISDYTREEKLNAAMASPYAVEIRDKEMWLNLFANKAVIEDPVGTSPYKGDIWSWKTWSISDFQLERFYETFFALNETTFHVNQAIVVDNQVVCDFVIESYQGGGLTANIPVHVIYDLQEESGALKISHLASHWDIKGVQIQTDDNATNTNQDNNSLAFRLLEIQGLSGALGYLQGYTIGIFDKGIDTVANFVESVNIQDTSALLELFDSNNVEIEFPVGGVSLSPSEFIGVKPPHIVVQDVRSSGWVTSFSFDVNLEGIDHHGIGFFEYSRRSKKIKNARFYWE